MTGLNEHHRRCLCVSFRHIDQVLAEAETIMTGSDSPFLKYIPDMTPVQRRVTRDHIARIREVMRRILMELDIPLTSPACGALWSVRTHLRAVDNTLEELGERYMRGYGALPKDAGHALNTVRSELQAQVARLDAYLAEGAGGDLQERLARLENTDDEARLLRELARIVTGRGLVEFRGALTMLTDRMEGGALEIGVFGRVSSGKSSLLNHLLGDGILPVGVTPVTAIPIRITAGERAGAVVEFTQSGPLTIELSRLAEFCAEQHNPGNAKHVTRILVRLHAPLLRRGVTFVDTPGLGSLALAGAEETVAYLPSCDLGIVLVDAASALTHEDLAIIESLYRAGATAMVLISKADLLTPEDRERLVGYTRRQVREQAGLDVPVHAVSVRGADAILCQAWVEQSLGPVLARHVQEASLALKRKIGGLRQAVTEVLRQRLTNKRPQAALEDRSAREAAMRALREGEAMLDAVHRELPGASVDWAAMTAPILDTVAQAGAWVWRHPGEPHADPAALAAEAAMKHVSDTTSRLRGQLEQFRSRISSILQSAEKAVGRSADAPDELPLPAGMPAPNLDGVECDLPPMPFLVRWNGTLLRRWLRRQLQARMASLLREMLARHGQQLRAWMRSYVEELQQAFWSRAELCRVREGVAPETAEANDEGIEEDLRVLTQGRLTA